MKQITFTQMDFDEDMRVFIPVTLTTIEKILITEFFLIIGSNAHLYHGPISIKTL